jgi:hypothetical protein
MFLAKSNGHADEFRQLEQQIAHQVLGATGLEPSKKFKNKRSGLRWNRLCPCVISAIAVTTTLPRSSTKTDSPTAGAG